jgi:HEAT repeat protein
MPDATDRTRGPRTPSPPHRPDGWRQRWRSGALAVLAAISIVEAASGQGVPLERVVEALQSQDPRDRLAAVRAIGRSGRLEALAALAIPMRDPLDEIQLEAIDAALSLLLVERVVSRRRVALVIEVRNPPRTRMAFELGPTALLPVAIPPELAGGLIGAMQDEHPRVRLDATYLFGAVASPPAERRVAEILAEGLMHPAPDVRVAVAAVMGRLRIQEAGEALIYAMNDPYRDVRLAAMAALGDLREHRAVQALTEQFAYYERGQMAEAAAQALAQIGNPGSLPLFTSLARDRSVELRRSAYEGMGRAGDPASLPALEAALASEAARSLRVAIAFALQKLGRPQVAGIMEGLADERLAPRVREYLIELGPPVLPAVQPYLYGGHAGVRAEVAHLLGLVGDTTAAQALDPVRADPDPDVAQAAERAIQRIRLRAGAAPASP